jgi:hypothetical protein
MSEQVTVSESKPPTADANGETKQEAAVPLMLANPPKHGPFDWERFVDMKVKYFENQEKIWSAAYGAFMGLYYALEPDGTAVRAVGRTEREVINKIRDDGDDPSWYTIGLFEEI